MTEADDGQGSGVASVDYALNGGAWTPPPAMRLT
ncbi:MAG: hypothetical protein CM15mP78_16420 [Candidatus Poseidoniales archaeon]|nr:MAG: hypothetical protein CM15mP78_16420 [Candidatus Poseidoniales archaeon]